MCIAGSFRVFVIRQSLTWTTWSLSLTRRELCYEQEQEQEQHFIVADRLQAICAHTHGGWAHTDSKSAHFLLRKSLALFSCAPDLVRTWGNRNWFRILSLTLYQLSHPVTSTLAAGCLDTGAPPFPQDLALALELTVRVSLRSLSSFTPSPITVNCGDTSEMTDTVIQW